MNLNISCIVKKTLFVLLCLLTANAFAQSGKGRIYGKVIDASNQTPVDYATISIYKASAACPFNGTSSDAKGNFSVSGIADGTYKITVDFLGYQRASISDAVLKGGTLDVGTIKLSPVQNTLKGVTITAKAPIVENKIDKSIYNVTNDLTAQGGVAIDVLKKVPQVSVDIDGNVELQGSSAVRFLINGKPSSIFGASLADALQSIPASQIKSIEVITSPGAKYDASGTGGIINIVLKDNKVLGINGLVNLSAGTRLENGSVNLNIRHNNFGVGLFFSGNAQLNSRTNTINSRRSFNNNRDTLTMLNQSGFGNFKRNGFESGINFQWDITPKDNLTASIGLDHFGNNSDGLTNQYQTMTLVGNAPFSNITSLRNSDSRLSSRSIDLNLDYKKTFKKEGRELEFNVISSFGRHSAYASQQQDYNGGIYPSSGIISNNPGKDRETDISLDYVEPVSKNFTIETGAKAIFESLNNNVVTDSLLNDGTYGNNSNQTYGFNYKRKIYAGYLSTTFGLFNFFEGKAGLRYERTNTTADFPGTNIPGYNTFAPSFVLSHKLDESQSIKLAYSYRIERPDYGDLNPFYNISDPHNISTGNPNLRPEIGHNYELGYSKSFKSGANFNTAIFYRHNTDDIQQFSTFYQVLNIGGTDYNNVTLMQRYNIGSQTGVGVNLFASVLIGKLTLRSNVQLGNRTNSTPGLAKVSAFVYRLNLNASYEFASDLVAEVFGNYNSSQKNLQGTRSSFGFYNIALRKQFWNKKASIGVTTANPFSRYITQTNTTSGANFAQTNIREVPYQSFGITLSYKFGKLEFKKDKDNGGQPVMAPDSGN